MKLERKQADERKALGLKTPPPVQPKPRKKPSESTVRLVMFFFITYMPSITYYLSYLYFTIVSIFYSCFFLYQILSFIEPVSYTGCKNIKYLYIVSFETIVSLYVMLLMVLFYRYFVILHYLM